MEEREGETKGGSCTFMDPYQSEAFIFKLHDLSSSLVQFSLSSISISRNLRGPRSELWSQGALSRIATPAAILLFAMMSRETPPIGISHRRIKCVLERGGQRVARRHSREACERSSKDTSDRERERDLPAHRLSHGKRTELKFVRHIRLGRIFKIDRSSSETRN